jgi:hypothetical protein
MPPENTDVKTEETSSSSSDVKGQESSTEQQAVETAVESLIPKEGTEETAESEQVAEAATEETSAEETTEEEMVEEPKHEEAIPYERFKEVNEKVATHEKELESLRPQAARMKVLDDYTTQNNIAPAQLQAALEFVRLLNSDPKAAFKQLQPTYQQLAQLSGEMLPTDLQERVAAGTLDAELAKELAESRVGKQYTAAQQQMRGMTQQQQSEFAVQSAIDQWDKTTQAKDPDFKPKAADAVDGKREFVDMKLRALRQANPPANPQQALAQVEKAYDEANKFFKSFRKTAAVKRPLQSQQSTQNANTVVKTEKDAVLAVLAGKKPFQMKYS